jgi:uncharacterized protein YjdB
MKKKSLSLFIALTLATTTMLPAANIFGDTTTPVSTGTPPPVTTAPASTYGIEYEGQVQSIGWQAPVTTIGDQQDITTVAEAGTVGKSLRVEALKITGTNLPSGASITYQSQVQGIGWQAPVTTTGNTAIDSAAESGTDGKGLRDEAIKITLNGMPGYGIKYQVHVQNIGWMDSVETDNGTDITAAAIAGTVGKGLRIEAVRIELVKTDAEKAAEVTAINAVEIAEASGMTVDTDAATKAIADVQDTVENASLTARINALNAPITVSSVKATSTNSFAVALSAAPLDTSTYTFTVLSGTTPVTMTPSWSADGATATLTSASNLPAGTYTVDVKNVTTDLGTTSVTITEQKIASIKITSTTLAVQTANGIQTGYASYKVLDQYGTDITTLPLANTITFQTGVGGINASNGEITIKPSANMNLITFPTVEIMAYDLTSGISTSATLKTSTQLGTLSSFVLGTALTNASGGVLTGGDSTDVFYLPFTATDIDGNPTTNYNLITAGLITRSIGGNPNCLITTDPDVTAQIIQDPNNENNAVIQVTDNGNEVLQDMPVGITAVTYTGKSSSFKGTLKRQETLYKITLQPPTAAVAQNDTSVTIPFTAVDQDGDAITAYSSFFDSKGDPLYTFSSGTTLVKNADGSASIVLTAPSNAGFGATGDLTVTATTTSGQQSSVNIDIEKNAGAYSLTLGSSIVTAMEQGGSNQSLGVVNTSNNPGGLFVVDQYGRNLDLANNPGSYEITASSSDNNVIALKDTNGDEIPVAVGTSAITLTAGQPGSATVTFNLIDTSKPAAQQLLDTKSEVISVVQYSSITGYTLSSWTTPIYAWPGLDVAEDQDPPNYQKWAGAAYIPIYGKTASGAEVQLSDKAPNGQNTVLGVSFDSPYFRQVTIGDPTVPEDGVQIMGYVDPSNTSTTETGNFTVSIMGTDGVVQTITQAISSSSAPQVASSVNVSVSSTTPGISVDSTGNNITINTNFVNLTSDGLAAGDYLTLFKPSSDTTSTDLAGQKIYLYPTDQFNMENLPINVIQTSATVNGVATNTQYVSSNGQILVTPTPGTEISLTGVCDGQTKSIKLSFISGQPDTTALAAEIKTASATLAGCTAASWNSSCDNLKSALNTAQTDIANLNVAQSVINADTNNLATAVASLVDTTALNAEIANANTAVKLGLSVYSQDELDAITTAITQANTDISNIGVANKNVTQSVLDADTTSLKTAVSNTIAMARTNSLNALNAEIAVVTAEIANPNGEYTVANPNGMYTAAQWTALNTELGKATADASNASLNQTALDSETTSLTAAYNNIKDVIAWTGAIATNTKVYLNLFDNNWSIPSGTTIVSATFDNPNFTVSGTPTPGWGGIVISTSEPSASSILTVVLIGSDGNKHTIAETITSTP